MSKSDIFDYINNCYTKAIIVTSDSGQPDSPFMAARWLSLNPQLLLRIAQAAVVSSKLPGWATGVLLFHIVPPGRPGRFKYPSRGKKDTTIPAQTLKVLMEYYNCKEFHAIQIFKLLTAQGIDLEHYFGNKLRK
jgi:hypothetical protein